MWKFGEFSLFLIKVNIMVKFILSFVLFFIGFNCFSQMTPTNAVPYNDVHYLINNEFLNSTTSAVATDVQYSGASGQIGYFSATGTNLGLEEGIILATGGINNALPGTEDDQSDFASHNSDNDLAKLMDLLNINTTNQRNAVVVEFDFIAGDEEMEFEYVFASDEYKGFTCTKWNDVFGFFISGPGISGPFSNNGKNIALVPNPSDPSTFTNTPVMVNSINSGVGTNPADEGSCEILDANWKNYSVFFNQNLTQTTVGFNGFTKVLKAKATVQCGKKYHIKLAITDVGDNHFNSAVFLKKGSFDVGSPLTIGISGQTNFVICDDEITIDPLVSGGFPPVDIKWYYQGNFLTSDPTITTSNIGNYKIVVSDKCGSQEHNFTVSPYEDMILSLPDTLVLCTDTILTPDLTGGAPLFNYQWKKDGVVVGNSGPLSLFEGDDGNYSVIITDNCGFSISDNFHAYTPQKLEVTVNDKLFLCDEVNKITASVSGGYGKVEYYWLVNGVKTFEKSIEIDDDHTGNIYFIAYDECGTYFKEEVQVFSPVDFSDLEITFERKNFKMCTRDKKALPVIISGGVGGHTVLWVVDGDTVANSPNYIFNPENFSLGSHTVEIIATDECDNKLMESFTLVFDECNFPNVFSPIIKDGRNDYFILPIGDFRKNVQIKIFNRWGMELFASNNYEECSYSKKQFCWDGKNSTSGKNCTQGVYYYIIEFENGESIKGTFSLF